MNTSVHFFVKYDGPSLQSHQMDVKDLAPALLALSNLIQESVKAVNPELPSVQVNVTGSFRSGSFGIDLVALQSISEQIFSIFSGREASAAANLFGILSGIGLIGGVGGGGLIALIKWLKGRKPSSISIEDNKAVYKIIQQDVVESFEVDLAANKLYQTRVVRQALAKVVKPLESSGIDVFACGMDGRTESVITSSDAAYFANAADEADIVSESLLEKTMLQIESASFKDGNKWRFSDGSSSTFFAEILDEEFLKKIDLGIERFGKRDVLIVDLRKIQSVSDAGLKSEYVIERVHAHREPLQRTFIE